MNLQSIECGMTSTTAEGLEELLPAFHGQNAQVLAYVAAKGSATPDDIRKDLMIPRSTVYKLLSGFFRIGLAVKKRQGRVDRVSVPDFAFLIKNTAYLGELKVTPRNILAFDSIRTPAGRMFAERHGPQKFAKFVELYDNYERGNTTSQLLARELNVTRYEIESLLSDIRTITPVAIQIGRRPHHR